MKPVIFATVISSLVFSSISSSLHAQPVVQWETDCPGGSIATPFSIVSSFDGGSVIAGWDDTSGSATEIPSDVRVIKLNSNGAIEWSKCFGGSKNDVGTSILQTSDGGFMIAGYTLSSDGDVTFNHGGYDVWVVKVSSQGKLLWQKTYGGTKDDFGSSIVEASDGGFVIAGTTSSFDGDVTGFHGTANDVWVFKIDSTGNPLWNRCYAGGSTITVTSMIQACDDGFAITGYTGSDGGDVTHYDTAKSRLSMDFLLLKLDSTGLLQWNDCYGGSSNDVPYSIVQCSDGSYTMAGTTSSNDGDVSGNHGNSDIWLINVDSSGGLKWQKCLGGSGPDYGGSIVSDIDRNYLIGGVTGSYDGDVARNSHAVSMWVVSLDTLRSVRWQECVASPYNSGNDISPIAQTADLGITVCGGTFFYPSSAFPNDSLNIIVVKLAGVSCTDIRVNLPNENLHGSIQQSIEIPIIALDSSTRPLSILDCCISLKTDLLTPLSIDPRIGVFSTSQLRRFAVSRDSLSIRLQLSNAISLHPGDTLCVLNCIANLTSSLSTKASIQRLGFEDPPFNSSCLQSSLPSSLDSGFRFTLISQCGDPTLSAEMQGDLVFAAESITPNPTSGLLQISLQKDTTAPIHYELFDPLGALSQSGDISSATSTLDVSHSPSGSYYLRLSQNGFVQTRRVVVER